MADLSADVRRALRAFPDFPYPGIVFQDITPVLRDGALLRRAVDGLAKPFAGKADLVIGIESRGFILGPPVALQLKAGFVPTRKLGKLPGPTLSEPYGLEYGEATLEIQEGSIEEGERVLVVDDVLATGGTAAAAARLVERAGGTVAGYAFLLEVEALKGRANLEGETHVLLTV